MLKKSDIAAAVAESDDITFVVGESVFVRMVTYHVTGKIVRVSTCGSSIFLHLADAAWIPESGRWADALATGTLKEVEPAPGIIRVNVASIVDCYSWDHPLPRKQK